MAAYILSKRAEEDLVQIIEYTVQAFGVEQMRKYVGELERASENMATGKGSFKEFKDLHQGLRIKRSGKHFIFGLHRDHVPMIVIAIFHERMDIINRVRNRLEG